MTNKPDRFRVGDYLRDNDPRMGKRVLTILEVLPNGVVARDRVGRARTYLAKHIHSDGMPRRGGFDLVTAASLEPK